MTQFAMRSIQLALQIANRAGLGRRRSPPSGGGDQLSPGVEQVGGEAQLLRHHLSRLSAVEPVLNRLAFEGFIEFPTPFDRGCFDGINHIRFSPFLRPSFRRNPNVKMQKLNYLTHLISLTSLEKVAFL